MKVLIIGANGYIGKETGICLARAGHTVYGLVRKEEYGKELLQHEIQPVIGDIADFKVLEPVIEAVSVIIDTVQSVKPGADPADPNRGLVKLIADVTKKTGARKRYIYTSGVLVYGDHPGKVLTEEDPLKGINKWRINWEKEVCENKEVDGVVIRPGWVYGLSSGHYIQSWFSGNDKGDIEVAGNPDKQWSWVHVTDLGNAFVAVAGAGKDVIGHVFNVADSTRSTFGQVREAMARAGGAEGKVIHKEAGTDAFSQMLEGNAVCSAEKLQRFTGWRPKHGPFLDKIRLYAAAAKASKADGKH